MSRQKARAGATQIGQELAGSRSAPRSAARVLAPSARGLRTATRPNKKHAAATILTLLALAASNGTSISGFLGPVGHAEITGRMPTAEWARQGSL